MKTFSIIIGYVISTFGGALILWLLIDKIAWGYLGKKGIPGKASGILTLPMGILERFMYTTVFLVNQPAFIAVWLALKVASQWRRWEEDKERGTYNIFLMGSALSLIIAFLGAWIALGHVPLLESK
jgi:hypothetical protein